MKKSIIFLSILFSLSAQADDRTYIYQANKKPIKFKTAEKETCQYEKSTTKPSSLRVFLSHNSLKNVHSPGFNLTTRIKLIGADNFNVLTGFHDVYEYGGYRYRKGQLKENIISESSNVSYYELCWKKI